MGKLGFFSSLEGMSKQNTGKDRADQLKQEMKKTQHKQNTTTHLNYWQGSQDVSQNHCKKLEVGSRIRLVLFQNRPLINSKQIPRNLYFA